MKSYRKILILFVAILYMMFSGCEDDSNVVNDPGNRLAKLALKDRCDAKTLQREFERLCPVERIPSETLERLHAFGRDPRLARYMMSGEDDKVRRIMLGEVRMTGSYQKAPTTAAHKQSNHYADGEFTE